MKKIKTGIIGTGKVADLHAEALKNIESSVFTAVCNPNYPAAKDFAEKYGVTAYKSEEEMIVSGSVEAATIATPHPVHAKNTTAALNALGVNKVIFVERGGIGSAVKGDLPTLEADLTTMQETTQ